jgi:hypothetical protein
LVWSLVRSSGSGPTRGRSRSSASRNSVACASTPLLSHTLLAIYVAALAWGGLSLRGDRVPALIVRRPNEAI